ncbi:U4/U6.U5 tri-snRNP-associated protein 2-like [Iris pallida]|uniref:U4/U6.U5 tri-snRNP-associated protein 2-like n=1 Tax=Iris pallida TaxID=29817 RepID=A0AAX6FQ17_IRIPA|nr:U4/U6.U5 tri-snRNP-associated protein 2-like [Iris pallida]KAJ6818429.1 U4/U6.U5 tri-snRNP-associated protein 2-like [Iris pallida]
MCVWQSPNLSILFDPDPDCAPRADRLSRLCLYPFFCLSLTSPLLCHSLSLPDPSCPSPIPLNRLQSLLSLVLPWLVTGH